MEFPFLKAYKKDRNFSEWKAPDWDRWQKHYVFKINRPVKIELVYVFLLLITGFYTFDAVHHKQKEILIAILKYKMKLY